MRISTFFFLTRRGLRNLRSRSHAADDFAKHLLTAKPPGRLDGKLIRVIENENHVVHASFPPTGCASSVRIFQKKLLRIMAKQLLW